MLNKIFFKKNYRLKTNLSFEDNLYIEGVFSFIIYPYLLNYKKSICFLKEEHLNLKSEFNNFKKRSNDELSKSYKYAVEDFFEDLLPVLDSLEAALLDKSGNNEKVLEGIKLTLKLFLNVFEKNNIKIILPELGENFDPYKHMAVSIINNNNNNNNNNIFNILQKGYSIFDRIIRPALVVVSKV